jgi:hypothetical protein
MKRSDVNQRLTDYSIKAKRDAWLRLKKDVDAVEASALGKKEADTPGGAAYRERRLLDRLRGEDQCEIVGEAWLHIERHAKKGDEGQRIIRGLLDALTLSTNTPFIPIDYQLSLKRLKELRGFADQLYVYFKDEIARDPMWAIAAGSRLSHERDFTGMIASLEHVRLFLTSREDEFQHVFGQMGLTREIKATIASRVVFSAAMSKTMQTIFGKWLDDVVRVLTDVAFGTATTIDQVKSARKNTKRRTGRTEASEN